MGKRGPGAGVVKDVAHKQVRHKLPARRRKLETTADYLIRWLVEGAQDLWECDKYHSQKRAVEQVEGFVTTKRTAALTGGSTLPYRIHENCKAWWWRSRAGLLSTSPTCGP